MKEIVPLYDLGKIQEMKSIPNPRSTIEIYPSLQNRSPGELRKNYSELPVKTIFPIQGLKGF
jgi:hypothetical protein